MTVPEYGGAVSRLCAWTVCCEIVSLCRVMCLCSVVLSVVLHSYI